MAETDLLNEILTSNPNHPATNGAVLLLRVETKSEFKSVRSEMNQRFDLVDQTLKEMKQESQEMKRETQEMKRETQEMKRETQEMRREAQEMRREAQEMRRYLTAVGEQLGKLIERSV